MDKLSLEDQADLIKDHLSTNRRTDSYGNEIVDKGQIYLGPEAVYYLDENFRSPLPEIVKPMGENIRLVQKQDNYSGPRESTMNYQTYCDPAKFQEYGGIKPRLKC